MIHQLLLLLLPLIHYFKPHEFANEFALDSTAYCQLLSGFLQINIKIYIYIRIQ